MVHRYSPAALQRRRTRARERGYLERFWTTEEELDEWTATQEELIDDWMAAHGLIDVVDEDGNIVGMEELPRPKLDKGCAAEQDLTPTTVPSTTSAPTTPPDTLAETPTDEDEPVEEADVRGRAVPPPPTSWLAAEGNFWEIQNMHVQVREELRQLSEVIQRQYADVEFIIDDNFEGMKFDICNFVAGEVARQVSKAVPPLPRSLNCEAEAAIEEPKCGYCGGISFYINSCMNSMGMRLPITEWLCGVMLVLLLSGVDICNCLRVLPSICLRALRPRMSTFVICLRALQVSMIELINAVKYLSDAVIELLDAAEYVSAAAMHLLLLGVSLWMLMLQFECYIRCLYGVNLFWSGGIAAACALMTQRPTPGSLFVVKREFGATYHSGSREDDYVHMSKNVVGVIVTSSEAFDVIAWIAWSPDCGCEVRFDPEFQSLVEWRGSHVSCDACRHLRRRCNVCRDAQQCREHWRRTGTG